MTVGGHVWRLHRNIAIDHGKISFEFVNMISLSQASLAFGLGVHYHRSNPSYSSSYLYKGGIESCYAVGSREVELWEAKGKN